MKDGSLQIITQCINLAIKENYCLRKSVSSQDTQFVEALFIWPQYNNNWLIIQANITLFRSDNFRVDILC